MSTEERIPTSRRLADALRWANAPSYMIKNAEEGAYDDFKSDSAQPIERLIRHCIAAGMVEFAERAKNGEFDSQQWESDEWARSPEGQATFREFFGTSQPHQGSAKMKFRQPKKR